MPDIHAKQALQHDFMVEPIQFLPTTPNALKLTIYGQNFPSKKNHKKIAYNKRANKPFIMSSPEYQEWAASTSKTVLAWKQEQKLKHKVVFPFEHCSLSVICYYPDRRRRDLSNAIEGINDILVSMGILKDDCWTVLNSLSIKGRLSASKPRLELYISQPLPEDYSK